MAHYYVNDNQQANGDHEVHREGCSFMPDAGNRTYVGNHSTCGPAVAAAKKIYPQSNGRFYCSRACHTGFRPFCVGRPQDSCRGWPGHRAGLS